MAGLAATSPLVVIGALLVGVALGAGIVYGGLSGPTVSSTTVTTTTVVGGQGRTQTISQTVTSYVVMTRTITSTLTPVSMVPGSRANITVSYSNLYHGSAGSTAVNGYVKVVNTGSENAAVDAIYITYGGQTCNLAVTTVLPQAIVAGDPAVTFSTGSQVGAGNCNTASSPQEQYAGLLYLSNGEQVSFSGIFF